MKKLKYLLFLSIIFLFSNVFAKDVTTSIQYNTDTATGTYKGDEIALGGYNGRFDVKTRYNGKLSFIEFVLSSSAYDFDINTTYTITLNMATNDWRNNFMGPQVIKLNSDGSQQSINASLSVSNFQFVSRKSIKFNFKTNNSISPYLLFRLYSTDYASTNNVAITGDSNWNLNSIIIDKYTTSSGSGNTGSGSSITNTNITCSNGLTLSTKNFTYDDVSISNSYINSSGNIISNSGYGVITYISISPNTNYVLSKTTNSGDVPSYCLSSSTSSYGSCFAYNERNSMAFNSGSSSYLTFSIKPGETATLGTCISPVDNQNQNTQDIIDNQNQNTTNIIENNNDNTQQIIDNQNQNTQDIIDNQNQNTQQQIESEKVCKLLDKEYYFIDGQISSSGTMSNTSQYYGTSDFIRISSSSTIKILSRPTSSTSSRYCFYDNNKSFISCDSAFDKSIGDFITIPDNASYFRFTFQKLGNFPSYELCNNGNQSLTDSITDSNIDSDTGTGFFDDFNDEDFGLSDIITIPLTTIQSLTSKTCSALSIPIPFTNSNISLPCMTEIYNKFPTIFNLWHIVSFGIISYFIAIDIFHLVKGFKDPESDKVEVLDL